MHEDEIGRTVMKTPIGNVSIYATRWGVSRIVLGDKGTREIGQSVVLEQAKSELERYFEGEKVKFALPLDVMRRSTPFRVKVWTKLMDVECGTTVSYKELARQCGKPKSWRAIAGAVAANPLPIVIPCHRVIKSDGSLGGFTVGLKWKEYLLKLEGAL